MTAELVGLAGYTTLVAENGSAGLRLAAAAKPDAVLLDVNMPEPSFTAPYVSETRTFRFKLRVTDKKGADSVPAYVDVTVEP